MTSDLRLPRSAFVDVVTHVSAIVCLEPGWTLLVPAQLVVSSPGVALVPPLAHPSRHRMRSPDTVDPGL